MISGQTKSLAPPNTAAMQKKIIRRRFLESVSGVYLALAIIALPLSLARIPQTGLHVIHFVHICGAILAFIVYFSRKRLSDHWLVYLILFFSTVLSISGFLQYGIVSAGFYLAGATIFIAGVSLGLWSGVICAGFYAVAATIIAYLWMTGYLVFPGDVHAYILLPSVWATLGVAFIVLTAVFFVSATGFFKRLNELVDTIDGQKQKIEERSTELIQANQELEAAIKEIKTLHGLLPICAKCKKIRDDKGYWQLLEDYLEHHTEAELTHGLCPDCISELYPEVADRVIKKMEPKLPE